MMPLSEDENIQGLSADDYRLIFKAIMVQSKDGLFVTDHMGNVVMVNRACEVMNGFKAEEVLGRNVRDLIKAGFFQRSATLEVIKQNRAVTLITATSSERKILSTAIPIHGEKGVLRFVLVNDRDISFLNQITDVLEEGPGNYRPEFSDLGSAISELNEMVVQSPSMQEVIYFAVRAAKFDLPLIITGDTGVGKNSIVKLIHKLSNRKNGPFVTVNCGSLTGSLLESELFGYVKGAFTGASMEGKAGLFEIADQGTLLLDEIGEIPLSLQAKLLHFVENGEIVRVGGLKSRKINTRIIAATNRDLEKMVEEGTFRRDLFFRLNVIPIHVPRLVERQKDIGPFVMFFLDRFNIEFRSNKTISATALNAIQNYHFPGNVRELENLMKRLTTMVEGDTIYIQDLPAEIVGSSLKTEPVSSESQVGYREDVNRFEQEKITTAIKVHGSQRKAAKALGISQSTISRRLGKLK
ncbi:MAG: sigma 54-interacting transcriptional regulator [Deltaproteobacteria bacterium]|nr:sigma 54-interacting transcriptional regulator [Deltaproteobacteria bacterium]